MSSCSLYIPKPVDPAREFYGVVQVCCGTCQRWDPVRERCREEGRLLRLGASESDKQSTGVGS